MADAFRTLDVSILVVLVILVILWLVTLFILVSIHRILLQIWNKIENNNQKEVEPNKESKVTHKAKHSEPSTPIPLLSEEDENPQPEASAKPETQSSQATSNFKIRYGRQSLQFLGKVSSTPDIPSNVYDEITNLSGQKKFLYSTVRNGSRKRKPINSSGSSRKPLTAKVSDPFSMSGSVVLDSFSVEESAKTPNSAFDGTNFVTFKPTMKVKTVSKKSKKDLHMVQKSPKTDRVHVNTDIDATDGNIEDTENCQTYQNVDKICKQEPEEDGDLAEYIPMTSVLIPHGRKFSLSKPPQPTPRSGDNRGFYIAESPKWQAEDQDGAVGATKHNVFFSEDFDARRLELFNGTDSIKV